MPTPPPLPPLPSGSGSKKKKKALTPAQQAARDAALANAKAGSPAYLAAQARLNAARKAASKATAQGNDPFVTIRNGRLVPVKKASQALHIYGQPVTRSGALGAWQRYNDLFLSYLGRPISAKEFQHFTNAGWSQYQIINKYLVNRPNFSKSPIWKQRSGDYVDVWHQIYGEDSNPDMSVIKNGIVNNLSQGAFADGLRQRPDYVKSNEFKTNTAQLSTVYTKIYGMPDGRGDNIVKQAALSGWTQDEFADWLRHQPTYTQSEEFQSKALTLGNALGLIGGNLPTMTAGPPSANPSAAAPGMLPTDPRAPKPAGAPTATTDLNVNSGGFAPPF